MSSSESEAEDVKNIPEEKQQDKKTESEEEDVKDITEERQQDEKSFKDLGLDEDWLTI